MKKLLLFSLCLFMSAMQLYAQSRTVTGTVTAKDDGLPVPGVTIRVAGQQNGTVSGTDGRFSISVPSDRSSLLFSFIGYDTQTIPVAGKTTISVVLITNARQLNEVVVTGLGVATEKRKVPIEVSTVSSKDFAKTTTTDIQQALQGQIAGAQIQQTSGQPNQGFTILLRGVTNLGGSSPIILVDGIQVGTDASALNNLDPQNVDRVEVVKGAAGGMLYGAQGANGVIQIFTKKGGLNRPLQISLSSKVSVDNILKAHNLIATNHHFVTNSSGQILDANGNVLAPDAVGFWANPEEIDPTAITTLNNKPYLLPTYDHFKQGFRSARTYTQNVSINGGSDKTDYAFTASRLDQSDVFSNNYRRTNLGINLGIQLAKGLTLRNNISGFITDDNLLGGNRFGLINSYPYIDFTARGPDGYLVLKPKDENQLNSLSEKERHQHYNRETKIIENFNLNYKFPKFVELDYKYGITYDNNEGNDLYFNQTNALQTDLHWGPDLTGGITKGFSKNTFKNSLASIYFRTDFKNDFGINLPIKTTTQASYDYRRNDYTAQFSQGIGLALYPPFSVNGANTKNAGDSFGPSQQTPFQFETYGVLVNQTIDFANLFGISGGFRSDYSSVFGAGSKPFTFPRGTVYFNPSELLKQSWLDNWKLRAAYGRAGIQPNVYTNQLTLGVAPLGSAASLSTPTTAANPNLQVQTSSELEIGTDFTILPFKGDYLNRITFSGSYWKRESKDIIQPAPVAPSTGFANVNDNFAQINQNGVDLSLDATAISKNAITWNVGVRMGFTKSTIVKINQGKDYISPPFILREGQSVGEFYGQVVIKDVNDVRPDGSRYIPTANLNNYVMVNGNVVEKATDKILISDANDLRPMGNSYPKFTASLINNLTFFKNLTLGFQFDWVHGNDIYNQSRQWLYRDRLSSDFDGSVNIPGQGTGPYVAYYNSAYNSALPVSYFVEDGSFIRLRDLSLSYDFSKFVHTKWLKRLVVTAGGRNLATFTKYKGLDPENTVNANSQGAYQSGVGANKGVDLFGVPNLRSYQFGVNVGF